MNIYLISFYNLIIWILGQKNSWFLETLGFIIIIIIIIQAATCILYFNIMEDLCKCTPIWTMTYILSSWGLGLLCILLIQYRIKACIVLW